MQVSNLEIVVEEKWPCMLYPHFQVILSVLYHCIKQNYISIDHQHPTRCYLNENHENISFSRQLVISGSTIVPSTDLFDTIHSLNINQIQSFCHKSLLEYQSNTKFLPSIFAWISIKCKIVHCCCSYCSLMGLISLVLTKLEQVAHKYLKSPN